MILLFFIIGLAINVNAKCVGNDGWDIHKVRECILFHTAQCRTNKHCKVVKGRERAGFQDFLLQINNEVYYERETICQLHQQQHPDIAPSVIDLESNFDHHCNHI